jgi:hypothetical protein
MPLCPNGSQPKPASPAGFYFETSDIASFVPPLAGLVAAEAMGLPTAVQDTAVFCGTDPPTEFPTLADYASLSIPWLAIVSGAYRRFGNYVKRSKWNQLCQCAPAGGGWYTWANPGPLCEHHDVWNNVVYSSAALIGSGVTSIRITMQSGGGKRAFIALTASQFAPDVSVDGQGGQSGVGGAGFVVGGSQTFTPSSINASFATLHLTIYLAGGTPPPLDCYTFLIEFTGGTPTTPDVPALQTPPPYLSTTPPTYSLADVKLELQALDARVQLIQQLLAQPQYVPSTVHAGLSGAGEIAIATSGSRAMALAMHMTATPTWLSARLGDPIAYYSWGWIALGTSDGWHPHIDLIHNPQLIAPLPPSTSVLGYSLLPGVTATVLELAAPL